MMKSVRCLVDGEQILLFVRAFYGQPSTYLWDNDVGEVHTVPQGEGGEQGDPLMPLLFCLGQHLALVAVSASLKGGQKLFAFLDDLYIVCRPERVGAVHALFERQRRHFPPCQENKSVEPKWQLSASLCCTAARSRCRVSNGHRVVKGRHTLPTDQQGLKGGCQSDTPISCSSSWSRELMSSAFCWNGSFRFPTLSRHSSSCHFARRPGQIFSCGQSTHTSQTSSLHRTTTVCGSACVAF